MLVSGTYTISNSMIRQKLLQIKDKLFNSSKAELFFNELETKENYMYCNGTIEEISEFLQEIYNYTNISSRIICYDAPDDRSYNPPKKCDIYDESGKKLTTIKIKRDMYGDSKVDNLINQYKDVDILVIVSVENANEINTTTGRNYFRSKYGTD